MLQYKFYLKRYIYINWTSEEQKKVSDNKLKINERILCSISLNVFSAIITCMEFGIKITIRVAPIQDIQIHMYIYILTYLRYITTIALLYRKIVSNIVTNAQRTILYSFS